MLQNQTWLIGKKIFSSFMFSAKGLVSWTLHAMSLIFKSYSSFLPPCPAQSHFFLNTQPMHHGQDRLLTHEMTVTG